MRVDYINLDHSEDRNARFIQLNSGCAELHRIEAYDGDSITIDLLLRMGVINHPVKNYSCRVLASALSHLKLWEKAVDSGLSTTIAEDDAVLRSTFAYTASEMISWLPADWDVILWGWNFDSILQIDILPGMRTGAMVFDPRPLAGDIKTFQHIRCRPTPIRVLTAFGLLCYTVSPKGAYHLKQHCFPLEDEAVSIPALNRALNAFSLDIVMNKHYPNLQAYICFPPIAWSDNDKSISTLFDTSGQPHGRFLHTS
jgi:GR25 family glycosyltransferase involved in LPS biosynthesis